MTKINNLCQINAPPWEGEKMPRSERRYMRFRQPNTDAEKAWDAWITTARELSNNEELSQAKRDFCRCIINDIERAFRHG